MAKCPTVRTTRFTANGARRAEQFLYQLILKEAGWLTAVGISVELICAMIAAARRLRLRLRREYD